MPRDCLNSSLHLDDSFKLLLKEARVLGQCRASLSSLDFQPRDLSKNRYRSMALSAAKDMLSCRQNFGQNCEERPVLSELHAAGGWYRLFQPHHAAPAERSLPVLPDADEGVASTIFPSTRASYVHSSFTKVVPR